MEKSHCLSKKCNQTLAILVSILQEDLNDFFVVNAFTKQEQLSHSSDASTSDVRATKWRVSFQKSKRVFASKNMQFCAKNGAFEFGEFVPKNFISECGWMVRAFQVGFGAPEVFWVGYESKFSHAGAGKKVLHCSRAMQ